METKEIKEVKIGKSGTGKKGPWTAYQVATTDPDVAIISVEAHLEKLEKQQQSKGQEVP